jgi:mannose-6-phosphate isomerase-like protein (cupin superfamily)
MTTLIDLNADLAKLKMFRDRTPTSTRTDRQGSSSRLAPYRDATIFASKSAGKGAWERHPDGDELVHVIDGAATLQIATASESRSFAVSAGMLAIVPQGVWHRFQDPLSVEPQRD